MSEELDEVRRAIVDDEGGIVFDDEVQTLPAISPQCVTCANLLDAGAKRQCKAYPNGIPDEVWTGLINHRRPYQGDNGIQYERRLT